MSIIKGHITTNEIEHEYSKFTSIEHRKKFAQFFTPFPIADLMAKWLLGNGDLKTVLEPAFGLGVFTRALLNYKENIENRISCKLNGFTNLYTLFLLKSIYQLNVNGRAAYIIPSEFLNSDYGKLVKKHLIKSKTLRHIIVINFDENVFDDALTTASILLCANDNKTNKVQFSNISNIQDLGSIDNIINSYPDYLSKEQIVAFEVLNPDIKWKMYYQKQNSINYKNLVPFANYGKEVRGIATGANEYFTFSPQ
jgi:adenine-specific DNA-methyltransferase